MTERTTKVSKSIRATPEEVYRSYLDPERLAKWRFPEDMKAEIHEFEAQAEGIYKMTLTYKNAEGSGLGKTTGSTDTFKGQFLELVPNKKIVELIDFDSDDPKMAGQMKMTTSIVGQRTAEVTITCENIPDGIKLEDNMMGCEHALDKLAKMLEFHTVPSSRHISVMIRRPMSEVYEFVSHPPNLPKWASGLSKGSLVQDGEFWVTESPMGKVKIRFAANNSFGVLDHDVILESGVTVNNPMRVLKNGEGSEVVFTLFRQPDMTEEKFKDDAKWVEKDLNKLKELLEGRGS